MKFSLSKLAAIAALGGGLVLSSGARAQELSPPPLPPPSPAPSATAAATGGWDTPYALLFSLNNIFQSGAILGNYQNYGVGGQLNLGPKTAVRLGVGLARQSYPAYVMSETRTTTAGGTTTSKEFILPNPNFTSKLDFRVGGDVLFGLTETALMPYVGAGLNLKLSTSSLSYTNDAVENTVNKVDDGSTLFGVGLRGILGVQWRVHHNFALFAEYALGVDVVDVTGNSKNRTTTTTVGTTTTTTTAKSSGTQTSFLVTDLNLAQGASLGLLAFF